MSSTTSVNSSGLSYLTQILGSGQQSSLLSSSGLQPALQNASAEDVAELSDQALELQSAGVLFGDSASTATSTTSNDVLAALSSGSSASAGTPSLSTSLAAYSSQQQENLVGSLLNVSA